MQADRGRRTGLPGAFTLLSSQWRRGGSSAHLFPHQRRQTMDRIANLLSRKSDRLSEI